MVKSESSFGSDLATFLPCDRPFVTGKLPFLPGCTVEGHSGGKMGRSSCVELNKLGWLPESTLPTWALLGGLVCTVPTVRWWQSVGSLFVLTGPVYPLEGAIL